MNSITIDGAEVKSISAYRNGFDLMSDTDEGSRVLSALPTDEIEALKHADDYEAVLYLLINYDTVVMADSINGDILGISTLKDFVLSSAKWAYDEVNS